jgi:ribosomal protein S18 acetylase RimI-like enzyme
MGPNRRGHPVSPAEPDRADPALDDQLESPGRHPSSAIAIRAGTEADAAAVAALHASQISGGFLSLLGPHFLKLLYRRICTSPRSFLIIAECDGQPAGFIAGSTDVPGLYKSFLWHDGLKAATGAAGRIVRSWRRVLETLRHGASGGDGVGRGGELLAVAVHPGRRGRGAGRMLVASFLDEIVDRGYDEAHVVVGADNGGAIALYQRAGFMASRRFELHPGSESLLMQWVRPPTGPTSDTSPG